MKFETRIVGLALLISLIVGAGALAQVDPEETPATNEEQNEESGDASQPDQEGDGSEAIEETTAEADAAALAAEDDAPAGQASMERFKPTEKISEDRSVAFPNDI